MLIFLTGVLPAILPKFEFYSLNQNKTAIFQCIGFSFRVPWSLAWAI